MNFTKKKKYLLFIVIISISYSFCGYSNAQDVKIISDSANLQLISSQFAFTEGATADKYGNIYFTDQPNNKIWRYDTKGNLSVFMQNSGRSNGMYINQKGKILACADEKNELWEIDPSGEQKILLKNYRGFIFNGPNDVWQSTKGYIYFTDPYYQRDYWSRKAPDSGIAGEKLYCFNAKKNILHVVDSSFVKPNGVVGTKKGNFLYVADIGQKVIYKYSITKRGELLNKQVFCKEISDGLTLDNLGNVYLAGNGVTIYNSKGIKIKHIEIPEPWTANVCFGGKNFDILFITACKSVYIIKTNVKGNE